ncbi:unnamed protein product [Blumeria hordei]|uniref:DUF202 domain-containing protein n=1 Tax=Blumeria hordei TaxID=2867405 RepID=A0A383UTS1_BLUHO|nr:unnamed protein product [Blumeria hordei]
MSGSDLDQKLAKKRKVDTHPSDVVREGLGKNLSHINEETWIVGAEDVQCAAGNYASMDMGLDSEPEPVMEVSNGALNAGTIQSSTGPRGTARHNLDKWWTRMIQRYGSLELENKGSVARDHLALERTFLAWLRTSLAFSSLGIAITQLFRLKTNLDRPHGSEPQPSQDRLRQMGKPLGTTFLVVSIIILILGSHRYFECQHWVVQGKFPVSRGSIISVMALSFALIVASLMIVIVVGPSPSKI